MPRSTEEAISTREALEELVRSDGWRVFLQHAAQEWQGVGYVARMRTALARNDINEPKIVDRTAIEIARLLQWPADQVRSLKGTVDE